MKNKYGDNIQFTVFGESHGSEIGALIEGVEAGIKVDDDFIQEMLSKRRPRGKGETKRIEADNYRIVSGVFNNFTTGAPICILIKNENTKSSDYEYLKNHPRPSHADYVAKMKYNGFNDYRGGGTFSGRLTASIVATGAIIIPKLQEKGIYIATHIKEIMGIRDTDLVKELDNDRIKKYIDTINNKDFPTITDVDKQMQAKIEEIASSGNSIGGICQTVVLGLPVGVGDPYFSSIESKISEAIFGIGAIKGIEFGLGFDFKNHLGSEVLDEFCVKDSKVLTTSNNNGGINGGISNGMPVIFNTIIKPTPTIKKEVNTVNLDTLEEEKMIVQGRHDPAIIRRIAPVITSMTAIVIYDLLNNK